MDICYFCAVVKGQTPVVGGPIFSDDLVYAYHWHEGEPAAYLGHLVLVTRRHTPDFASLTSAEAQAIGLGIARLSAALKACAGAEKVYAVFYGEVTPHLHVHLTARYPLTPAPYLRWNVESWPDAPRGGVDEIAALCRRLHTELASM